MYGDIHLLHLSRLADFFVYNSFSLEGQSGQKRDPFFSQRRLRSKGSCELWSIVEQNKLRAKPITVPCLKRIFRFLMFIS